MLWVLTTFVSNKNICNTSKINKNILSVSLNVTYSIIFIF